MSEHDIKAGQQWAREIGNELDASSFGIVCITRENQSAPFLNFEAGALSKRARVGEAPRVAGYLLGVKAGELDEGPLSLYQHKEANLGGTHDLLKSLNDALEKPDKPLRPDDLQAVFEKWWPELDKALKAIPPSATSAPQPPRDTGAMLEEVVEAVRRIERNQQALLPLPIGHIEEGKVVTLGARRPSE